MKHTVVLFGVVHPEGGSWYLDNPWKITSDQTGAEVEIILRDSHYSMRITIEGPDDIKAAQQDGSFLTWINEVVYGHQYPLRSLLDALGLHLGAILDPQSTGGVIEGLAVLGTMPLMTAFGTVEDAPGKIDGKGLVPSAQMGLSNLYVRSALADVRNALRFDNDTLFFCYRALDSLREHYAATAVSPLNESAQWTTMRTDLDIDKGEIMTLKGYADKRRHGSISAVLHADHLHWTRWTRDIIVRFIAKHAPEVPTPQPAEGNEWPAVEVDAPAQSDDE